MSTAVGTYSSLLDGMWAPEGSEINDRLKKLQDLERMRKEREARRNESKTDDVSVSIRVGAIGTRTRLRSRNEEPSSLSSDSRSKYGIRRTMSHRGSQENLYSQPTNYGGARPKFGGSASDNEQDDGGSIFSGVTASLLGTKSVGRTGGGYGGYSRSLSQQQSEDGGNPFSDIVSGLTKPKSGTSFERRPYTSIFSSSNTRENTYPDSRSRFTGSQSYTDQYEQPYSMEEQENGGFQHHDDDVVNEEGHVYEEEGEEEEPIHFIERLRNTDLNSDTHPKRHANSSYLVNTIPSVPPLKRAKPEETEESEDPAYDILAVAKDIRNTFGVRSPNTSDSHTPESKVGHFDFGRDGDKTDHGDVVFKATSTPTAPVRRTSSKRRSSKHPSSPKSSHVSGGTNDAEEDVHYELIQADYSSDEETRDPLPERAFAKRTSDWHFHDHTLGKLDHMQEYFTGVEGGFDPNISHELNGSCLRADMEKSFTTPPKNEKEKHPETSPVSEETESVSPASKESNSPGSTVGGKEKGKKKNEKGKSGKRTNSKNRVEQIKSTNGKSSDSDNDSFKTASESESDVKGNSARSRNKVSRSSTPKTPKNATSDNGNMGIGDKLAKLESMTQEKIRKKSIGESDGKRPVPSYMAGTKTSQSKVRAEAITPERNLVKDVRDIKKFVRENSSEPNTPQVSSAKKSEKLKDQGKKVVSSEIGVQTDFYNETMGICYTCKHCGKSSNEPVSAETEYVGTLSQKDDDCLSTGSRKESEGFEIINHKDDDQQSTGSGIDPDSSSEKHTKPILKHSMSSSRESLVSNDSGLEERRYVKSKTAGNTRSYMKGTASSKQKNAPGSNDKPGRKGSIPELAVKDKNALSKTSSVLQRAKAIEGSTKSNGMKQKARSRPTSPHNTLSFPVLSKAKSVEQMELVRSHIEAEAKDTKKQKTNASQKKPELQLVNGELSKSTENEKSVKSLKSPREEVKEEKQEQSEIQKVSTQVQKFKKPAPPPISPKPKRKPAVPLEKIEVTPLSPRSKPPIVSPLVSPKASSPLHKTEGEISVESTGQFTRLEDNPFIRNDASAVKRSNSMKGESVWEKAGSRSRDSSLRRSNSNLELDRASRSSERRGSNASSGQNSNSNEKSLHQLSWSASSSSGSLHKSNPDLSGSRSKLDDSNGSLNDAESAFGRARSVSSSSNTSQNTMLNLLNSQPAAHSQGPVETDVDAAYDSYVKETSKHNEDSVDKAHLEFARQALNMLEFETQKRDSSNESAKDRGNRKTRDKGDVNGNVVKDTKKNNDLESVNYDAEPSQRRPSKREKKGFRKLFKK